MTDVPHPAVLPTERLEHEVTTLAAQWAAATARWLLLVAELDRREAWKGWGCRSCAEWLSLRCGIGLATARGQVRVARALEHFPSTAAAFGRGELSFSQVRAIVRLDATDHEQDVIDLARHATGAHLERIVRSYNRASASEEERRFEGRSLRWQWDDDGCLVVKGRLAPEDGALFLAAVQEAEAVTAGTPEDDRTVSQRRADALTQVVRSAVSDDGPAIPCEITVIVEDGHGRIEDGPSLDKGTVERLACDAAMVPVRVDGDGEELDLGRRSYRPNRAQRRARKRRDDGRCQFPGCQNTRHVQMHHVDWWERDQGETNVDVLVTMCRFHHRLVHKRVIGVLKNGDGTFTFCRADGLPITPPERTEADPTVITRRSDIDESTAVPRWGGEPLDLDLALTALFSWRAAS